MTTTFTLLEICTVGLPENRDIDHWKIEPKKTACSTIILNNSYTIYIILRLHCSVVKEYTFQWNEKKKRKIETRFRNCFYALIQLGVIAFGENRLSGEHWTGYGYSACLRTGMRRKVLLCCEMIVRSCVWNVQQATIKCNWIELIRFFFRSFVVYINNTTCKQFNRT